MTFEEFHKGAWQDHATQAESVAARLPAGIKLIHKPEQVPQMALLIAHVLGEHLGLWDRGIEFLHTLRPHDDQGKSAVARYIAGLDLAAGDHRPMHELPFPDQVRAQAFAVSALCAQKNAPKALEHAHACLALCQENQAQALELFIAHQTLGLAERACGNRQAAAQALESAKRFFQELSAQDKAWAEKRLLRSEDDTHL